MSERTALEIADRLKELYYGKTGIEAAAMLRQQYAKIARMEDGSDATVAAVVRSIFDPAAHAHRQDCCGPNIGTDCTGCTMAERDAYDAEIERLKRERHHIYDLLARIHRDGGQYTAEHGIEKACDDAEAQVVTWLETLNSVDALIEQARIAERELCAEVFNGLYKMLPGTKTGNALQWAAESIRARGKS